MDFQERNGPEKSMKSTNAGVGGRQLKSKSSGFLAPKDTFALKIQGF